MELTTHIQEDLYYITLYGDLDACSSIMLDIEMGKALCQCPKQIRIDCEALHYISSTGLGVFISYLQQLAEANISLILENMNEGVKYIFDITGLSEMICIIPAGIQKQAYAKASPY